MSNPDSESPSSKSSELSDSSLDQVSGGIHKIERNIVISKNPGIITDVKTDASGNVTGYTEVHTRNMEARPWQG